MVTFEELLDRYDIESEPMLSPKEEEYVTTSLFRATNKQTFEKVIIKMFQLNKTDKGTAFSNFNTAKKQLEEEIRVMNSLKDNPYTVKIINYYADFIDSFKEAFIVMDFAFGESVKDHVSRNGGLSISNFYRFAYHFINAMNSIHEKGVIHRDISSNNVFIAFDSENNLEAVKIIDFGAAYTKRFGVKHKAMFTSNFAPPESCNSILKGISSSYDIYSAGVVLYYILKGYFPYNIDVLTNASQEKYYSPLDRTDVPPEIENFIKKCLKFNSIERPKSMTELKSILLKHLRKECITIE